MDNCLNVVFYILEYGGIYLDTDEVMLRSIKHLRRYNFTLSHAYDYNLSNGVIISTKNATFLQHWYEAYRNYISTPWGHFSTIMPSKQFPNLIHIENKTFVNPDFDHLEILFLGKYCWAKNNGIHIFIRQYQKQFYRYQKFKEVRIMNQAYTFFSRQQRCFT